MKFRNVIITSLVAICVAAYCFSWRVYGQTQSDMKSQVRNMYGLIKPRPGTIVVCVAESHCESLPDGSSVVYRTVPPAGPGSCYSVGTGAFSVDEKGYLYWCSPPWDGPVGQNNSVWMRSTTPVMSKTWTPDRPPGAPTLPTITTP